MDARYERNLPALTEAECALLRKKRALVVGCGGLGGHIIDQLTRIGIGAIRAVDGDVFEPSNLNRQILSQMTVMGRSKAQVAAEYITRINPETGAEGIWTFLNEGNAHMLLSGCDIVVDALDNIPSRKILARACKKAGIPYVYGAIHGWVAQAAISMPGDDLVETIYPENTILKDKSVLSFTPALCASMQVSLCVKLLTGRPVETGTIYYVDMLNQEFEVIKMV